MRRGSATTAAAGLLLAALTGLPAVRPAEAGAAGAADPLRILVVGDSLTQGSAGDWTWRYRLAQHLTASGVSFDLVGPKTGLWDNIAGQDGATSYVDPAFDQDHAARWGLTLAFMGSGPPSGIGYTISELVADYDPDVVIELLGVNDLTFLQGAPAAVRDAVRDFVEDARAADPQLDFVLGRIPRSDLPQVATFNDLLTGLGAELDSPGSRVSVAPTDAGYDEQEDTWDGGHPNSHGELKIAAAVEDALSLQGIGPPAVRPLPDVPRGPRIPPELSATGTVAGAHLSWAPSPGATESEIWLRDLTEGGSWTRVAEHVVATSYDVTGLPAWHVVQLRTQPAKGAWVADPDAWSNTVGIETLGTALDAPAGLVVRADRTGVASLAWAAVLGATSYSVQWRPADRPDGWLAAAPVGATATTVSGLANRAGYVFRVQAMRGALGSFFSDELVATVPALPPVGRVRVSSTNHGIRTSAHRVAAATSYTVRWAAARSCARAPRSRRFTVAAAGLGRPVKVLRVDARAVWVRWVAVRDGVEGDLASSSSACVRLSH